MLSKKKTIVDKIQEIYTYIMSKYIPLLPTSTLNVV